MAATRKTSTKKKPQSTKKSHTSRARKESPDKGDSEKTKTARQALQAKMLAASYGEIVSVLMRSPHYKHYSLADLEWLVLPPLLAKQFTLAEARTIEGSIPAPVGVALWARVSEEVDKKLSSDLDRPLRLRPDEWTGGDILWLIGAIGAPEVVKAMVERMGEAVFDGKPFKLRAHGKDGKMSVQTIKGKSANGASPA